jgi:hypothetical protein
MNVITANPTASQQMARQLINDRVRDAEQRRFARAARTRHQDNNTLQPPNPTRALPWWSFRFLRPAT